MYGLMEVNMEMYRGGVTVQTMNTVHRRGPVFYASLPCRPRNTALNNGHAANEEKGRHHLVSTLWDHLAVMESPLWKRCQSSRAALQIQVTRGPLGRPHLLLGEYEGPAVSFSECGGNVWAALCGDESDIGIDVAGSDEFRREYPIHRVFHPEELQLALRLADGDLEHASALLWSVKEAVVKALGCAFHLVDPLQITICPSEEGEAEAEGNAGYTFQVGLSGKALRRFPNAAHGSLWARAIPQSKLWLSIALLNRRPAGK
jgi:phosphopantetheinyl transferase (holo-ACP synthase)